MKETIKVEIETNPDLDDERFIVLKHKNFYKVMKGEEYDEGRWTFNTDDVPKPSEEFTEALKNVK